MNHTRKDICQLNRGCVNMAFFRPWENTTNKEQLQIRHDNPANHNMPVHEERKKVERVNFSMSPYQSQQPYMLPHAALFYRHPAVIPRILNHKYQQSENKYNTLPVISRSKKRTLHDLESDGDYSSPSHQVKKMCIRLNHLQ